MAMSTEQYHAEILKLRGQLDQVRANLTKKRSEYALTQAHLNEIVKHAEDLKTAIANTEAQIASLVETHGEPEFDLF